MQLYSARLIGSEESRFGQSPLSWARHRRIQMKCRSSPALLQTTLITICWNVIIDFCPMLSTAAQRTSIWPKRCSLFVHLQRKKGPRLTAYQSKIRSRHNSWIPITTRIPMSLNISVRCFLLNGRCLLLRGCSMQGSRVCKSTRPYRVVYKSSGQVSPMTLFEQRVGLNAEHPERVLVKRQQSW